jgi:hypothetical protein
VIIVTSQSLLIRKNGEKEKDGDTDREWTLHADTLIQRSSKKLNVLMKLKFRLKRGNIWKHIYFTFIRPILEYASEVWDN